MRPSGKYIYTLKTALTKTKIAKICSPVPLNAGDKLTFKGNVFEIYMVQNGVLIVASSDSAVVVDVIEE
ncbi:hypothetical protein MARVELLAND_121 [Bacillus phage vB_BspM_MarvelLand]|nr:hypothetical protein MARVELLAND_121 [Bacillus phage vB_BspM_MarvelLand]